MRQSLTRSAFIVLAAGWLTTATAAPSIEQANRPPAELIAERPADNLSEAAARLLEGRLVISHNMFHRVVQVRALEQRQGRLTLEADADALFAIDYLEGPLRDGERVSYRVDIYPAAPCGVPGAVGRWRSSDLLIFDGSQFVTPHDFFAPVLPALSVPPTDSPLNRLSPQSLARLKDCAGEVAAVADRMPFQRVALMKGDTPVLEVTRSNDPYEERYDSPDEPLLAVLTHLEIDSAAPPWDFSVEAQAVSVMQCEGEDDALFQLGEWKQGTSAALTLPREDHRFLIESERLLSLHPPFPPFTTEELQQAVARASGTDPQTAAATAASCAPTLRDHRFIVRYRGEVVQQLIIVHNQGY